MKGNHLTNDELFQASFDKENLGTGVQEHLSACPQCQKTITDYQSIESLCKEPQNIIQPSLEFTNKLKTLARESIKMKSATTLVPSKWSQLGDKIFGGFFWNHKALASAFAVLIVAGLLLETRDVVLEHLEQTSPVALNVATEGTPPAPATEIKETQVKSKPKQTPSESLSSGSAPPPAVKPQKKMEIAIDDTIKSKDRGMLPRDEDQYMAPPDAAPVGGASPGNINKYDSNTFGESKTTIVSPQPTESQLKKAKHLQVQGHFNEALVIYDSLYAELQSTPQGNQILLLSVQCYLGLHHNDQALQKLAELEQRSPRYPGLAQLKNKILKNK